VGKDPRHCIGPARVICLVHGGDCESRQPVVAAFGEIALVEILCRWNVRYWPLADMRCCTADERSLMTPAEFWCHRT
jgi:hypothetical protein